MSFSVLLHVDLSVTVYWSILTTNLNPPSSMCLLSQQLYKKNFVALLVMQYLKFSSLPLFQAWARYPRWYPSPSPGLLLTAGRRPCTLHIQGPLSLEDMKSVREGKGEGYWIHGRKENPSYSSSSAPSGVWLIWPSLHTGTLTPHRGTDSGSLGSRSINSFLCPSCQGVTLASCHPVSGLAPHLLPDFSAIPSPAWPTLMTHSVNFETTLQNPFQLSWESCHVSSPVIAKHSHPSQKSISLSL